MILLDFLDGVIDFLDGVIMVIFDNQVNHGSKAVAWTSASSGTKLVEAYIALDRFRQRYPIHFRTTKRGMMGFASLYPSYVLSLSKAQDYP